MSCVRNVFSGAMAKDAQLRLSEAQFDQMDSGFEQGNRAHNALSTDYEQIQAQLGLEGRRVTPIVGDGNCFYRAMSSCIFDNESRHGHLRSKVKEFMQSHIDAFKHLIDSENVSEYLHKMSQDTAWAETSEIYAAATMVQRPIFILAQITNAETYEWIRIEPLFKSQESIWEANETKKICNYYTLLHRGRNHFDVIEAINSCNCLLPKPQLEGCKKNAYDLRVRNRSDSNDDQSQSDKCLDDKSSFTSVASISETMEPPTSIKRLRSEEDWESICTSQSGSCEKKFSDSLFCQIKCLTRSLFNSRTREKKLILKNQGLKKELQKAKKEVTTLKTKNLRRREDIKRKYESFTCCCCVKHMDSVDRYPLMLHCKHICCQECWAKREEGIVCRVCRTKNDGKESFIVEPLLDAIQFIEKQLLED
ncbi:hypothetical protein Bpfe_002928 [Biomphalaria pfeifferi]|uniref:Ubiquitinyl hydrolase 1 n=1 Tax=Biomphalaria pfeifferi TaxID=112525 RepID=A0AAD8C6K7_BIOPF|nr:hypothetical protein Bpfe_002928 [Biomphalaria pfeifferi]